MTLKLRVTPLQGALHFFESLDECRAQRRVAVHPVYLVEYSARREAAVKDKPDILVEVLQLYRSSFELVCGFLHFGRNSSSVRPSRLFNSRCSAPQHDGLQRLV